MKHVIVNADDFGASSGINRGILEAFQHGILTSTSLMVNMPASDEAAGLSRHAPDLSVGLHINFTNEGGEPVVDLDSPAACSAELERQLELFRKLCGRLPTHLDSHHNVHRVERLLPGFQAAAQARGLPLREHSPVRYFSAFYGQWDGESHPEQISADNLLRMVQEFDEGFTELSCHPGYVDPDFESCYARERELELATLCDPGLPEALATLGVRLVGFRDLPGLRAA
jgi:predicted glycoside hydrolase/deacetylase ChbG (UPF0249 family)